MTTFAADTATGSDAAVRTLTALVLAAGLIAAGAGLAEDRPANAQPAKAPESAKVPAAPTTANV